MTGHPRPWLRWLLTVLVVAAATHALALWLVPRLVMQRALRVVTAPGRILKPPLADAMARRIVLPSPDLLYATCPLDLSARPMRVQARLQAPAYASVALYAANSDNVFVANDRQMGSRALDLWLVGPDADAAAAPAGSTVVRLPTARGLLLMRVLVTQPAVDGAAAEAVRDTLRCDPA